MKKITLLLATALGAVTMHAQNDYTFSTAQQAYANLETPTAINNGAVWDFNYFGEFNLPFTFTIAGQQATRFAFDDDSFLLFTATADYDVSDEGVFAMVPSNIYIQDRAVEGTTSLSPLSYKTEGTAPNRIFKLEVRNATAETASFLEFEADEFFLNYQIWLYEGSNIIEYRYGENNLSSAFLQAYYEEIDLNYAAVFTDVKAYIAYGNPATPTYNEYTPQTIEEVNLNGAPANGTVYKFTPAGTAGAPKFNTNTISLYPNPATTVLNIKAKDAIDAPYAIYNIMGQTVAEGNISGTDATINTTNLQDGVYVINIGGQHLKFIKKQ